MLVLSVFLFSLIFFICACYAEDFAPMINNQVRLEVVIKLKDDVRLRGVLSDDVGVSGHCSERGMCSTCAMRMALGMQRDLSTVLRQHGFREIAICTQGETNQLALWVVSRTSRNLRRWELCVSHRDENP